MFRTGDYRSNDQSDSVNSLSDLANVMMPQTNISAKLQESISKTKNLPNTTQIIKEKPPPIWNGQNFERFKTEIEDWSSNNKDTEYISTMTSMKV